MEKLQQTAVYYVVDTIATEPPAICAFCPAQLYVLPRDGEIKLSKLVTPHARWTDGMPDVRSTVCLSFLQIHKLTVIDQEPPSCHFYVQAMICLTCVVMDENWLSSRGS
jgi:hypothetical protein